jgi:spore maturation protein CgeB
MKVIICGLSITSSWGNGHTVTFRALARALTGRGHDLLFLERDTPWYGSFRDDLHQKELGSIKLTKIWLSCGEAILTPCEQPTA